MIASTLRATCHLPVDVLIPAAIAADEGLEDVAPRRATERVAHPDLAETAGEPRAMRLETKRAAAVDRHHLVDAIAVEKSPVEGRDASLRQRQILAVEITRRKWISHKSCAVRKQISKRAKAAFGPRG